MQALRQEDFDWKKVSTDITIGRELVEAQVQKWCRGATCLEALSSWGASGPPTGNLAANQAAAELRANQNTFMNSISREVYGAHGLLQFSIDTVADRVSYELFILDHLGFQLNGGLLANALDRAATLGVPSDAILLDWLIGEGPDDNRPIVQELLNALHAYWAMDYKTGYLSSVFQIESSLRQLALLLEEPALLSCPPRIARQVYRNRSAVGSPRTSRIRPELVTRVALFLSRAIWSERPELFSARIFGKLAA